MGQGNQERRSGGSKNSGTPAACFQSICMPLVFIGLPDSELDEIFPQLKFIGYMPQQLATCVEAEGLFSDRAPVAVITRFDYIEKHPADLLELLNDLARRHDKNSIPCLVFDGPDDMPSRLLALRAGGSDYYAEPLNLSLLIGALSTLVSASDHDIYRALIIMNDRQESERLAEILKLGHIAVHIHDNPFDIFDKLTECNPDFLILSMNLSGCTGTELARLIKQNKDLPGLGISFFEDDENVNDILPAVSELGAGVLISSMTPENIVSACWTQARRARLMRNLVAMDSLTGLLNHVNGKHSLEQEILRASREGTPFAFAMLDLDHFKEVNDTYGHVAGDSVLKTLATLLRQRLRRSDIVTRYGGEEFSVVMLGAKDLDTAAQVMDTLREYFSNFEHRHNAVVFKVSFSCGIAMYPEFNTITELTSAADQALYMAKKSGRNRVMTTRSFCESDYLAVKNDLAEAEPDLVRQPAQDQTRPRSEFFGPHK